MPHSTSWQRPSQVPWGTGKHPLLRTTLLDRLPLLVHPHGLRASGLDEGRTPSMYVGECQYLEQEERVEERTEL